MRHPLDRVLVDVLAPADVYAVGGRVRDEFRAQFEQRDLVPKDLDYVVCGLDFNDLVQKLEAVGKADVVGASFRVVKFRHLEGDADVALPRRERSTGTGHRDFAIESGPEIPISDDLGRRDFRMNMIARRLSDDVIVDPFQGIDDIAARRIDIVSDRTFEEDPLRLLRAAQFAARFGFEVSERARTAMARAASLVTTVSPQRVGDELVKLFSAAPKPSLAIELLRETGVLAELWPELLEGIGVEQNEWHRYDVYRHLLETLDATPPGDPVLRIAALLHDVGKPRTKDGPHFYRHEHVGAEMVVPMLERLDLPNTTISLVAHLVEHHMYAADPELSDKAIRRFLIRVGTERLDALFALRAADIVGSGMPKRDDSNERFEARVTALVAEKPATTIRDLAINGLDVMELLVRAGQAPAGFRGDSRVGAILKALFERVIDDPEFNERGRLLAAADDLARESP